MYEKNVWWRILKRAIQLQFSYLYSTFIKQKQLSSTQFNFFAPTPEEDRRTRTEKANSFSRTTYGRLETNIVLLVVVAI